MKNKATLLGIPLTTIVLTTIIAAILINSPHGSWHDIVTPVYAVGTTPDAYGNRIYAFSISQYIGGAWTVAYQVDTTTYSSGSTVNIASGVETYFTAYGLMNKTQFPAWAGLSSMIVYYGASNSTFTSETYINSITVSGQAYWLILYTRSSWTWTPASSTTYATTLNYRVYY